MCREKSERVYLDWLKSYLFFFFFKVLSGGDLYYVAVLICLFVCFLKCCLGRGLYFVAVSLVLGLFIYLINQSKLFSVELMLIHLFSSPSPNEVLAPSFFGACIILEMCVRQMNAYFSTKNINSSCMYYSKHLGYSRHYIVF